MSVDATTAEQQLLALYDRVADAPDAILRLRRFILDLAVRGKLVAQDPDDEPASELLKQAAVEKERLVKAGEIRKPRNLSNGEELKPPFEIPASWRWCRLDTIGAIIGGGTPVAGDPTHFAAPGEGIPWLTPADLGNHRELYISGGARDLSKKGLQSSSATLMPTGTVLFTSRAPIGYVAISTNPISTNQGFKSIVPYVSDSSRFIALGMQAFASEINAKAPGTTFKEVSGKIVAGIAFPLPPLAEQHRIVAKVEELIALLDRLDASRMAAESTRDRLAATSLNRLTEPDTMTETFPIYARSTIDALPSITTRGNHIHSLRQTILDLSVRGKLTEREGDDGSGSDLIEMIKATRKQSSKPSLQPDMSEVNIALPSNWIWQSLDDVITEGPQNGLSPRKVERSDAPKAITLTATTSGLFDAQYFKHVDVNPSEVGKYWLEPGDLLFQRGNTREFVGIAAIYDGPSKEFLFPDLIMRVKISPHMDCRFVHLWCIAPFIRQYMGSKATGAQKTMPKINQTILRSTPIAIPPLSEQRRIVAKVEELMALCDRLEVALTNTDTTKQRLLEVLLHNTLAGHTYNREAA